MNRAVFVSLAILCLLSISSITGLIHIAKADGGTITINADGSISPSNAPIHTADNVTYTLTGNISATEADGIDIERDDITLNGAGYTVMGSGIGNGTTIMNISNVTVTNLTIENFTDGIWLDSSPNNTLSDNNVANNSENGIVFCSSSNNVLSGNNVTANTYDGIYLGSSSGNTIYNNNFINNTSQVSSSNSTNVWDTESVGNYWSDYQTKYPNATQVDSSGVWNTPYVIDANNTDYYPLMTQYSTVPEFPSFLILSLFMMMATLLAVIVYKKKGVKARIHA